MSSFNEILHKIEVLMFYNMVSDDHIIVDEGEFNIPMENNNNVRYTFIDDKDFGERNVVEQKKIIFLNDIMDILSDLHTYIHENEPDYTPIYFNKHALKSKIEKELSVNLEEEIDGESGEEEDESIQQQQVQHQQVQQQQIQQQQIQQQQIQQQQVQQQQLVDKTIEQITNDVTDMEL
tara:strand:+ start:7123 stop:7656 length:534 start_codon:yes stop_codon:yes gene_type:complete